MLNAGTCLFGYDVVVDSISRVVNQSMDYN